MPPPDAPPRSSDVENIATPTEIPAEMIVEPAESTISVTESSVEAVERTVEATQSSVETTENIPETVSAAEMSVQSEEADETIVEVPADMLLCQLSTSQDVIFIESQSDSAEINLQNLMGEDTLGAVGGDGNDPVPSTSVVATETRGMSQLMVEVVALESTSSDDPEIAVKSEYHTSHSRHRLINVSLSILMIYHTERKSENAKKSFEMQIKYTLKLNIVQFFLYL